MDWEGVVVAFISLRNSRLTSPDKSCRVPSEPDGNMIDLYFIDVNSGGFFANALPVPIGSYINCLEFWWSIKKERKVNPDTKVADARFRG